MGAGEEREDNLTVAAVIRVCRAEFRARWRQWASVVLIIGAIGGVVLASAAGARRTDTAFPRFLRYTRAADLLISPNNTGRTGFYQALAKDPDVAAIATGVGLQAFTTGDAPSGVLSLAGEMGDFGRSIEHPKFIAGRLLDPTRADEADVDLTTAHQLHAHVGTRLHLSYPPSGQNGPDLAHQQFVDVRIVGVMTTRDDIVTVNALSPAGSMYVSGALLHKLEANLPPDEPIQAFDGAYIRLRPGANKTAFTNRARDLANQFPETGGQLFVADESQQAALVNHAIRPQAAALALFALLLAIAALFVVGQIISRQLVSAGSDNPTFRAIGLDRNQLIAAALIEVSVVAVIGAVIAAVVAGATSSLMPIGPARVAEPHPGIAINWSILGLGVVATAVLLIARVAWTAWRLAAGPTRAFGPVEETNFDRPSRILDAVTRSPLPTSAGVGVRLALQPGRGRTSVPVRTALAGTVVAIAAVAAALTFGAELHRLVNTPRLYGQGWELAVDTQFGALPPAQVEPFFVKHGLSRWMYGDHGVVSIAGRDVPTIAMTPGRGPALWPTLLEGRAPRTPDEILLGTRSLQRAHLRVGQNATVLPQGEDQPRTFRIVGRAVFPFFGQGSFQPTGLGDGAAIMQTHPNPDGFNFVLADFRKGAVPSKAAAGLQDELLTEGVCPGDQVCGVTTAQRPADVSNYARVRTTPIILAGVLSLLAVATIAHLLVTSIRRRRRDLAVLKTLGFVRRQVSSAVAWQASVFVGLALLVGIPLGAAAGRGLWVVFASRLGIGSVAPLPWATLLLLVPVALVVANGLAAAPGWVAGRLRPANVLRTE
jgi:ABC-type antimicrobial peptide transport system permease subunit